MLINCREEETFDVVLDALEAAYKRLQRQLHPDKFSTSSQVCTDATTVSTATGSQTSCPHPSPGNLDCILCLRGTKPSSWVSRCCTKLLQHKQRRPPLPSAECLSVIVAGGAHVLRGAVVPCQPGVQRPARPPETRLLSGAGPLMVSAIRHLPATPSFAADTPH
jgi:hypothetical protein